MQIRCKIVYESFVIARFFSDILENNLLDMVTSHTHTQERETETERHRERDRERILENNLLDMVTSIPPYIDKNLITTALEKNL